MKSEVDQNGPHGPGGVVDAPAIAAHLATLPALPALCQHLLTRLNDPLLDFGKLSEQVKYDPGMTANVLKLANSAHFGAVREIGSLREAFVRLGARRLFDLVIGAGVAPLLGEALAGYELRRHELLRHSAWTAAAAEYFAAHTGLPAPDMVFTAGLLHDVGKIVLDPFVEKRRNAFEQALRRGTPGRPVAEGGLWPVSEPAPEAGVLCTFEAAEREVLGMDHAEAGGALLERWNFPAAMVAAVRWHHEPESAPVEHRPLVNLVHAANMLACTSGVGAGIGGLRHAVSAPAVRSLGLTTGLLERVAGHTLATMQELERLLGGPAN